MFLRGGALLLAVLLLLIQKHHLQSHLCTSHCRQLFGSGIYFDSQQSNMLFLNGYSHSGRLD